jgi:DNA-binding transcriptional regulator YiaG
MTPEELRAIRERHGLSRGELAAYGQCGSQRPRLRMTMA